jgi:hypothetical protein
VIIFFRSDPYCVISCNGTTVQTSVKWANLNPDFKERFEIDVTNPGKYPFLDFYPARNLKPITEKYWLSMKSPCRSHCTSGGYG